MLTPLYWGRSDWDPFAEMRRLQSDMNRLFESAAAPGSSAGYPPVNLWVGESSAVVTAELPGLSSDDVELTVAEDTLTIRGARESAANDNEVAWHRRERALGTFSRTVELPFRVDKDAVQARFQNGVLEVEMQRPKSDAPRKIAVNAG